MQRKTTIPGKKSKSFDAEQNPWSLIGIVPSRRSKYGAIESNQETTFVLKSCGGLESGFSSGSFASPFFFRERMKRRERNDRIFRPLPRLQEMTSGLEYPGFARQPDRQNFRPTPSHKRSSNGTSSRIQDRPSCSEIAAKPVLRLRTFAGLAFVTLSPTVRRERILPEELLGNGGTLASEVLADHFHHLWVWPPAITVRPVATIHQPVWTECLPELIQCRTVEIHVIRNTSVNPAKDLRNLGIDLGSFPKLSQICLEGRSGRTMQ